MTEPTYTEVTISLCDYMNPSIGYQIRITRHGNDVLFVSIDPATGENLLTYTDALRVAGYYS